MIRNYIVLPAATPPHLEYFSSVLISSWNGECFLCVITIPSFLCLSAHSLLPAWVSPTSALCLSESFVDTLGIWFPETPPVMIGSAASTHSQFCLWAHFGVTWLLGNLDPGACDLFLPLYWFTEFCLARCPFLGYYSGDSMVLVIPFISFGKCFHVSVLQHFCLFVFPLQYTFP